MSGGIRHMFNLLQQLSRSRVFGHECGGGDIEASVRIAEDAGYVGIDRWRLGFG